MLRRRLAKIEIALTVNDLLLLARCDHAATYWPAAAAEQALETISAIEGGRRSCNSIAATSNSSARSTLRC